MVELAASEIIGHRRWAYQAGFQSTKESSSLKKAARSEILTGVRTEVWYDETEGEHQWLIHTEMKRKDKFKHLSFVKEKVNDLRFMLSEWIEPNKLQLHTELRLDGKLHRASPHCQGKPWHDWAMLLLPKNEDDASFKTVRLRDRLNEADTERRKSEEEALARERAAEIRREERLKKIAYMNDMPDSTPAGTGKSFYKYGRERTMTSACHL